MMCGVETQMIERVMPATITTSRSAPTNGTLHSGTTAAEESDDEIGMAGSRREINCSSPPPSSSRNIDSRSMTSIDAGADSSNLNLHRRTSIDRDGSSSSSSHQHPPPGAEQRHSLNHPSIVSSHLNDDLGSSDEVKVFKDEDEGDERNSESHQAELLAEKSSLITESEQVSFSQ